MKPLSLDSETDLIRPARLAPPLACVTWQEPGQPPGIADRFNAREVVSRAYAHHTVIGANIAYDSAVFCEEWPELRPLIFAAYDEDRVTDVQIRARLLDIAGGCYLGRHVAGGFFIPHTYDLEALAKRYAGMTLQKDAWRLSYGEFRNTLLPSWHARAVEVQQAARVRLQELEQAWSHVRAKDVPAEVLKERDGLSSMVASDPRRCVDYPLEDAVATLAVFTAQEKHVAYLADQFNQARAYFALHLSSAWGLHTDAHGAEVLRRETQAAYDEHEAKLIELGFVRDDKKRSRDTKKARLRMFDTCLEEGFEVPRTDGHKKDSVKCRDRDDNALPGGHADCVEHVSLAAEAIERFAADDPVLQAYGEAATLKKVLSNDVEALSKGTIYPVHTRYGLAETGRTTSSKPPIQNLCKRPGIREAFVPREGRVFAQCDYPTLELYTLAQCCVSWLGQSALAQALLRGIDPHIKVAAVICRMPYEEAFAAYKNEAHPRHAEVKRARQLAKPANFGFPGGMGARKFVISTRKNVIASDGVAAWDAMQLTEERAKQLKAEWYEAWPEMPLYFARVNALCSSDSGKAFVESLFTGRFRGGASYCQTANTGFQGLGADCAKRALWLVAKAEYVEPASPLFSGRTVAFIHDELIVEVDDNERAHDAAVELGRLMAQAANELLPDVPIAESKMEPLLMRRWSKNAKPTFDAHGRLVPWHEK